MISFLAESHKTLLRSLCAKFIKKDVFESAKKASLLIKLDVADKTNWKDVNSVDLGFGIKCELKRQIGSKKVTSMKVLQCKKTKRNVGDLGKALQPCDGKKSTSMFVCKVSEMYASKLHVGILKMLWTDIWKNSRKADLL